MSHRSRLILALALTLPACAELPTESRDEGGNVGPTDPAFGWVGFYDGSGEGTDQGTAFSVEDATMRIAFDADSVARASCPFCVTVEFDPWFSKANLEITYGDQATFSYTRSDTLRFLTLTRFSGAGSTANVLLAEVRMERTVSAGGGNLLQAGFSLTAR